MNSGIPLTGRNVFYRGDEDNPLFLLCFSQGEAILEDDDGNLQQVPLNDVRMATPTLQMVELLNKVAQQSVLIIGEEDETTDPEDLN